MTPTLFDPPASFYGPTGRWRLLRVRCLRRRSGRVTTLSRWSLAGSSPAGDVSHPAAKPTRQIPLDRPLASR